MPTSRAGARFFTFSLLTLFDSNLQRGLLDARDSPTKEFAERECFSLNSKLATIRGKLELLNVNI